VELNFGESNFTNGLMIFTGPSGAGKSVLLQGILAIFSYCDANAELSEAIIDTKLDLTEFGIVVDDEIIFKEIKKGKVRYFINNQAVSKKVVKQIANNFIDYLSLKNSDQFKSENLLKILDNFATIDLENYTTMFQKYKIIEKQLKEVEEKEKQAIELKEFLEFEIGKIEGINPKEGEFEELMETKKLLSKIEKLKKLGGEIEGIFEYEIKIHELFNILDVDNTLFDEVMNELRGYLDLAYEKATYLENVNIEEVLSRIEQLQGLIKRFGTIKNSLNYLKEKKGELNRLQNISFEKTELEKKMGELYHKLLIEAQKISKKRGEKISLFQKELNKFLSKLYMPKGELILKHGELNNFGIDELNIKINNTEIDSISTGEYNRLRLALLATKIDFENSPKSLFLDEIDANLSGEESMSVAEVLKFLSTKYQIFAISHQPQLTSKADKHFFVGKKGDKSFVKELNYNERVEEIARIISGKKLKKEAIQYAKELLKEENVKLTSPKLLCL
jgi:DNA repair protein RecN (Recombination protein N)